MGMRIMDIDEALHFLHEDGCLRRAILMHVDDINLAGDEDFVEKVLEQVVK